MIEEIVDEDEQIWQTTDSCDSASGRRWGSVSELCREHGMSNASFYKWRSKYGGITPAQKLKMAA